MISMDKKYQTRGGRAVRIYAVDAGGYRSVHGAMKCSWGWRAHEWVAAGESQVNTDFDLIEVRTAEDVLCDALDGALDGRAPISWDSIVEAACQALRDAGKLRDGE